MGRHGFRGWVDQPETMEQVRRMHGEFKHGGGRGRRGGPWGDWSGAGGPGWQGRQGPPPWVAGMFGLGQPERGRGPRVRRGDVRSAILDVLHGAAEEPLNGYQVIQEIEQRTGGAWKPSPGSVYPTIQQLQDEGLVISDDEAGRKTLRLSTEGTAYVEAHADELAAVWAPFQREQAEGGEGGFSTLKPEIGQVMGAVWQIVTAGTEQQQRAAIDVLVETRRKLYGILADGDTTPDEDEEPTT
jgi:DNA-binding PadR family transcriptional regulator